MIVCANQIARSCVRRRVTYLSPMGAVRHLNVHEYISMGLMQTHGIKTPECKVASTPEEAENIYLNTLNKRKFPLLCFHKTGMPFSSNTANSIAIIFVNSWRKVERCSDQGSSFKWRTWFGRVSKWFSGRSPCCDQTRRGKGCI